MNLLKCLVVFSFLILSQWALADGVFMVVKGDIKLKTPGKPLAVAKVGMKVNRADKIIAGKDSRAKIVMSDQNILNISPETELLIETYKFDQAKNEKNVSLNVLYGKVRATLNQKYDSDKHKFQVKTPSAVAGVRGTDFLTSYNPTTNASKVVTFEGSVSVGSGLDSSGNIRNPVTVPAGTFSVASSNSAPTPPAAVPPAELQAMNKDTNADGGGSRPEPTPRLPAGDANGNKSKDPEKEGPNKETSNKTGDDKAGKESGNKAAEKNGGPVSGNTKPGAPEGTRSPADAKSSPPPPPPSMISDMKREISGSEQQMPRMPDLPPVITDVYKPPEIPTDLIQQNTNLTVNVNVQ